MGQESLSEKLSCIHCGNSIVTSKTIGHGNSKRFRCPGCSAEVTLGDARANAKRKAENGKEAIQKAPSQVLAPSPLVTSQPKVEIARPVGAHDDALVPADPTPVDTSVSSELRRFVADGQNPETILRLLEKVKEICTSTEDVLYMAVQERPVINFTPEAVVLTNRRFIVFRPKLFNRFDLIDCLWLNVGDVHIQENLVGATIIFSGLNKSQIRVEFLPRKQARMIYRIAQEKEEEMHELRRERKMEEQRNAANQVNVTTPIINTGMVGSDPVTKLQQIKQMLDGGLITLEEYDRKKSEILSTM